MQDATCATSFTPGTRSSRAMSELCKVAGTGQGRQRPGQRVAIPLDPERAGLEHRLGHLLDVERHAVSAGGDMV